MTSNKFIIENWKPIQLEDFRGIDQIHISNYGRVKSYKKDPEGVLKKIALVEKYPAIAERRISTGQSTVLYIHRLVAQHYLPTPEADQKFVIHLDYNKENNHISNLAWASQSELTKHNMHSPHRIESMKTKKVASKLTEAKVRIIKKKIQDPNRKTRMKMIAKQFGISEMQLYRIKSGENWGHVTV